MRKEGSTIKYPFTPDGNDTYITGIKDCFLTVARVGEIAGSESAYRDFYVYLYEVESAAGYVKYTFRAVHDGNYHDIIFNVTRDQGIGRVNTSTSSVHGVLIVDTNDIIATLGTFNPSLSSVELEPCRTVWQYGGLTSMSFYNEERHWNVNERENLSETLLKTFSGNIIKIKDGHNCTVNYEESTGTLIIDGSPGSGDGYPTTTPWDTSPPVSDFSGIKTVNGLSDTDGNLEMEFSESLIPRYSEENHIIVHIEEDGGEDDE